MVEDFSFCSFCFVFFLLTNMFFDLLLQNIIQNCTDAVQSMVAASISNYVAMKCQNPEEKSPDLTTFPATPPDVADVSHLNF